MKSLEEINEPEKLKKLNQIAKTINSSTDLSEVFELILQQGIELLEVKYGDIWLVEKQTGDLLLQHDIPNQEWTINRERISRGKGVIGWVVENRQPAVIDDVTKDERYLGFVSEVKSELAFPLFVGKDVIGVINFESEKQNAFSKYQEDLLTALADHSVIAIRNARIFEKQEALGHIHKAILDSKLGLESSLLILLNEGLKLLETQKGQILLYDGNETLRIAASTLRDDINRTLNIKACVSGKAILNRETIYIDDVTIEPLYEPILGEEIIAEMAAPLISGDEILGVFNIENAYHFSNYDKRLLETLADQAATVIKNAQLLEKLKDSNRYLSIKEQQLKAFREIDEAIVSPDLGLDQVLHIILQAALKLIGAKNGHLLLREKDKLVIKVIIGEPSNQTIKSITFDQGVSGYSARTKRPVLVPDVEKNRYYIEIISGMKSELAYPLLDKQNVLGVLNAESEVKGFFTEEHVNILDSIKSQIIIAIQNAELQEIIRQSAEIISDINAARNLNETLERILDVGLDLLRVSSGQLLEVDESTKELVIRVTRGEYDTQMPDRIHIDERSVSSYVARTGTAVRISDVTKDNRYVGYLSKMRSELAVPLLVDQRVVGIINCESPEVGFFTEQHEKILRLLANGAAIAIENAKSRDKMMQMEIFAVIGTYNAELIHLIENKTAPMLGFINRVLEDIENGQFEPETIKSIKEDLGFIKRNSEFILDVKDRLLGGAKELELQEIGLADVLKDAITQQRISEDIMVFNIEPDLPHIRGDLIHINRVITEIIDNAGEAMELVEQKELRISLSHDAQSKKVILEIADNGCGISEEDAKKIYVPAFTTKAKGTGLGLSGVQQSIRRMGGEIFVSSTVGKGTTFTISFPAI